MLHNEPNQIDIDEIFKTFTHKLFWKMLIDTRYWKDENPQIFDQQHSPNYLANTTKALFYLLSTINDPVTIDSIISLHDLAYHEKTSDVLGMKSAGMSRIKRNGLTKEGLIEAIEKAKKSNGKMLLEFVVAHKDREEETFPIDFSKKSSDELADEILLRLDSQGAQEIILGRISSELDAIMECQKLLDEYHDEVKLAENEDKKKLTAIVRLIQSLHQYHPFNDGNGRTFIFLLLNKLLIQNGLAPTIVEAPGRFSGYSVDQLVNEVELGQTRFESLCSVENAESKEPFLSFLYTQIEDDEEFFNYITNEVYCLYKDYDNDQSVQNFVIENLDALYLEKVTKIYDPGTIKAVFNKTPPSAPIISDLLYEALKSSNIYFVNCLIEYCKEHLNNTSMLKSGSKLMPLFNYFELEQIQILFGPDKLNLNSQDSFNILSYPLALGTQTHFLLRNLLVEGKQSILQFMLEVCSDNELFSELMAINMRGINALQLIGLFGDSELFEYCCKRLNAVDKTRAVELIQQPITTTYKQEAAKLANFDFSDLFAGGTRNSHEKPSARHELGLYRSPKATELIQDKESSTMVIPGNQHEKKI